MPTMYDSIDVAALPVEPGAWYAGYVDGRWPTFSELTHKFHGHRCVSIAVDPQHVAEVLDVEGGNPSTPIDVVRWVQWMRTLHIHPVVYCGGSMMATLIAEFQRNKVAAPLFWIADWRGIGSFEFPGAVATQWTGSGAHGHYDISLVSPNWPDTIHHRPKEPPVATPVLPSVKKQPTASNVRQIAGLTALVTAFTGNLPNVAGVNRTAEWVTMAVVGAAIFIVEHYLSDPSTGNPPTA